MNIFTKILLVAVSFCCSLSASILEEARYNLSQINHEYPSSVKPSCRWQRNLDLINSRIHGFSNEMEVIEFAQTPHLSGFDHRRAIDPSGDWIEKNYQALLTSHPQFSDAILELEDSPANHPNLFGLYQGKIVTNTLFFLSQLHL